MLSSSMIEKASKAQSRPKEIASSSASPEEERLIQEELAHLDTQNRRAREIEDVEARRVRQRNAILIEEEMNLQMRQPPPSSFTLYQKEDSPDTIPALSPAEQAAFDEEFALAGPLLGAKPQLPPPHKGTRPPTRGRRADVDSNPPSGGRPPASRRTRSRDNM
mgnify:CR=1 FL=1